MSVPGSGKPFGKEEVEAMNEAAGFMRQFAFDTMKTQNEQTERPLLGKQRRGALRSQFDDEYIHSPEELAAVFDESQARARLGKNFPIPKEWWDGLKQIGKERSRRGT